jgi:hypothetical protein
MADAGAPVDEVEITPAMERAGTEAISSWFGEIYPFESPLAATAAAAVYRAMAAMTDSGN